MRLKTAETEYDKLLEHVVSIEHPNINFFKHAQQYNKTYSQIRQ